MTRVESVDKAQLRRHFRALREALPADQVTADSIAVCQRLANWPIVREAQAIMAYLAFRNEIDLGPLFDLLPHIRWMVPRVQGPRLILHPYDAAQLVRHRHGMMEPAPDLPTFDPALLDVVLVPAVAFDRHGGRLGFGGGFYDHFLPTTPALRVGVNHDCCLTERLPTAEYDQRVDWVVTPTQLIRCLPLDGGSREG